MSNVNLNQIFKISFNTFKAFENLTIEQASNSSNDIPKTVWQILNHLIFWQGFQLGLLNNQNVETGVNELDTWQVGKTVENQELLNDTVSKFNEQIESIKFEINNINKADLGLESKIRIIQAMAVHLSFHLGEIILLRRMYKNYPWPNDMKEFLK